MNAGTEYADPLRCRRGFYIQKVQKGIGRYPCLEDPEASCVNCSIVLELEQEMKEQSLYAAGGC